MKEKVAPFNSELPLLAQVTNLFQYHGLEAPNWSIESTIPSDIDSLPQVRQQFLINRVLRTHVHNHAKNSLECRNWILDSESISEWFYLLEKGMIQCLLQTTQPKNR